MKVIYILILLLVLTQTIIPQEDSLKYSSFRLELGLGFSSKVLSARAALCFIQWHSLYFMNYFLRKKNYEFYELIVLYFCIFRRFNVDKNFSNFWV